MTMLNQILAVRKGKVSTAEQAFTDVYQAIQRATGLTGITKTYQALASVEDGGEELASERQIVQTTIPTVLDTVKDSLVALFDIHATIDTTNQAALAPIVVDGQRLTDPLPVATLLTVEKKLTDVITLIKKIPLLDPAEVWTPDEHQDGVWRNQPVRTQRQKKVPRNHVKAKATDKHPEQVEVYYEDVIVGYWTTTKFSGAASRAEVQQLLNRALNLQAAVKQAREQANMTPVVDAKPGAAIAGYLFG